MTHTGERVTIEPAPSNTQTTMISMEMYSMVDPKEYQQLDNDWIDEFLEDNSDDVFEDLEFDDQSGGDFDIDYTTQE